MSATTKKPPTFTPLELEVWRIVRDGEGYSSAAQVMPRLNMRGFNEPISGHIVGGILKRLFTAGHLRQRKTWEGRFYGCTTTCKVPDGESGMPFDPPGTTTPVNTTTLPLQPEGSPMPINPTDAPGRLPQLLAGLSEEQKAQLADLTSRILHMATLGTPRVDSHDPQAPSLLVLHVLSSAYLALARATPSAAVAHMAAALAEDLLVVAQRHLPYQPS